MLPLTVSGLTKNVDGRGGMCATSAHAAQLASSAGAARGSESKSTKAQSVRISKNTSTRSHPYGLVCYI
eukprot:1279145-Prymnesium_polylepis.3